MYQKYSFHPIWFTGNASSHIKMTQKNVLWFRTQLLAIMSEMVCAVNQGDFKKVPLQRRVVKTGADRREKL